MPKNEIAKKSLLCFDVSSMLQAFSEFDIKYIIKYGILLKKNKVAMLMAKKTIKL